MTQETALALADKTGLWYPMGGSLEALHGRARLVEFAQLIEAAERERCARICSVNSEAKRLIYESTEDDYDKGASLMAHWLARVIRGHA